MSSWMEEKETLAASMAFVVAPLVYYRITNYLRHKPSSSSVGHPLAKYPAGKIKPPFPKEVRSLLSKCNLAYLSTVDQSLASSHLSLMRFTFWTDPEDGEVVIMSTNKQTKKFDMLQQQKGVALLIHDFDSDQGGQYSITLNGNCRIVSDQKKAEEYRQVHLQHNPEYPQFIVGEHIAILCVDVQSARICNINDQVIKWDVSDASAAAATSTEETVVEEAVSNGNNSKIDEAAVSILRV